MHFKGVASLICLMIVTHFAVAQGLTNFHHNNFWGRIVLSDKLTDKLKWELYLQKRTQNDPDNKYDIFKHDQLTSYWLWLHYQATKDLRISVIPFCYFNAISLYPQPADIGNRGIKELRWAVQLEHIQNLKYFNFANRYSLEYRNRENTGEPIPESQRIFERFYHPGSSSESWGLGLSIVKKSVDINGWQIKYEASDHTHNFHVDF
jgi:hypothetical protein